MENAANRGVMARVRVASATAPMRARRRVTQEHRTAQESKQNRHGHRVVAWRVLYVCDLSVVNRYSPSETFLSNIENFP